MKVNSKIVKIAFCTMMLVVLILLLSCSRTDNRKIDWYLNKLNLADSLIYEETKTIRIAVIDTYLLPSCRNSDNFLIQNAYNAITNDDDVYRDNVYHASTVINLIASKGDNGVYGIGYNAIIIPIVVFDEDGKLEEDNLISGLNYSIGLNVDIICCSFGTSENNSTIEELFLKAHNNGIIIIASCGDSKKKNSFYPAKYDFVYSIICQGKDGNIYSESNYEDDGILIPGVDILCPVKVGGNYYNEIFTGSSFSTAIFSGYVARLMNSYNLEEVEIILEEIKNKSQKFLFLDLSVYLKGDYNEKTT